MFVASTQNVTWKPVPGASRPLLRETPGDPRRAEAASGRVSVALFPVPRAVLFPEKLTTPNRISLRESHLGETRRYEFGLERPRDG